MVEFAFHYVPNALKSTSEFGADFAPEVASSHFLSLFNCDAKRLREWRLWAGFVREYRENNRHFQEWMETQSDEDWEQFMKIESPETGEMYWCSSPFMPGEAQTWAQTWIAVLENLSPEETLAAFPLDVDAGGISRFESAAVQSELRKLVAQSACAMQHDLQMTVDMTMSARD